MKIVNPDKILFSKDKITKEDLVNYYSKISCKMLPYIRNRTISMIRYPDGINKKGFFQKNAGDYFPDWIKTIKVKKEGGTLNQVVCNNKKTLLYLANQACIEIHTSLSKITKPNCPNKMIFDLDPPTNNFKLACKGALILKKLLEDTYNFETWVMTTGSKGLHVIVPLNATDTFEEVRVCAKKIATILVKEHNFFTLEQRKNKRGKKLYIDILRNAYGQTSIAPYSVRALDGAPIATPIKWNVLSKINSAQKYKLIT